MTQTTTKTATAWLFIQHAPSQDEAVAPVYCADRAALIGAIAAAIWGDPKDADEDSVNEVADALIAEGWVHFEGDPSLQVLRVPAIEPDSLAGQLLGMAAHTGLDAVSELLVRAAGALSAKAAPQQPAEQDAELSDSEIMAVMLRWVAGGTDSDHIAEMRALFAADRAARHVPRIEPFQQRVQPWLMACFGEQIAGDKAERNHRFLEEALELVQALGCTEDEARQLVAYVYGRPAGEPAQEAGGVMTTLAALCLAQGLDMHACGEAELARIWTKVEQIRAKQAAKPRNSPLPAAPQPVTLDIRQWEAPRFGVFHSDGRFEELPGEKDDCNHPLAHTARWVGGSSDMQLLRAALAPAKRPAAKFCARDDAKRLRALASGMSYNDNQEAAPKHILHEVAMRLETGGYVASQQIASKALEAA